MTVFPYDADVAKAKTTIYVDETLLRRMKVAAAREGKRDSEVVEEALREYLGIAALERVWGRNTDVSEAEAAALADEAKHATRPT